MTPRKPARANDIALIKHVVVLARQIELAHAATNEVREHCQALEARLELIHGMLHRPSWWERLKHWWLYHNSGPV